jgi:microcystin-dependent protein
LCNGSAVSRTVTYDHLFAVISTTFGTGDGANTFNVPDFRGVYPKGAGTTNRDLGKDANGNFYAATIGTYCNDSFQGHYHRIYYRCFAAGSGTQYKTIRGTEDGSLTSQVREALDDGTNGGPRTGLTTEPQNLGITFIIKY